MAQPVLTTCGSVQDDGAGLACGSCGRPSTGLLTIAVLAVGGIYALQYATVIIGPAVRRGDRPGDVGPVQGAAGRGPPGRLRRPRTCPPCCRPRRLGGAGARERVEGPAGPGDQLRRRRGRRAPPRPGRASRPSARSPTSCERARRRPPRSTTSPAVAPTTSGRRLAWVELRDRAMTHPFVYRVEVHESPGAGVRRTDDRRPRPATPGSRCTSTAAARTTTSWATPPAQVIHDCLDQYEQHLEFLRWSQRLLTRVVASSASASSWLTTTATTSAGSDRS